MKQLIVLVGAGQNVSAIGGQFMPDPINYKQPPNSVIHLVDPLIYSRPGTLTFIESQLRNLNPNNKCYKNTLDVYLKTKPAPFKDFDKIIFVSYTIEFKTNPQDQLPNSLFLNFGHSGSSIDLDKLTPLFETVDQDWIQLRNIATELSNLLVDASNLADSRENTNNSPFDIELYRDIIANKMANVIKDINNSLFDEIYSLIIDQLQFTHNFINETIGLLDRKQLQLSDLEVDHKSKKIVAKIVPNDVILNTNLTRYFKLISIFVEKKIKLVKSTNTTINLKGNTFNYYDVIDVTQNGTQNGEQFPNKYKYKYLKYKMKYQRLINKFP